MMDTFTLAMTSTSFTVFANTTSAASPMTLTRKIAALPRAFAITVGDPAPILVWSAALAPAVAFKASIRRPISVASLGGATEHSLGRGVRGGSALVVVVLDGSRRVLDGRETAVTTKRMFAAVTDAIDVNALGNVHDAERTALSGEESVVDEVRASPVGCRQRPE